MNRMATYILTLFFAVVSAVSYAAETNSLEPYNKAVNELRRMVNENQRYIQIYDARIREKNLLLEETVRKGLPALELKSEINTLKRERAIRANLVKRWQNELAKVNE